MKYNRLGDTGLLVSELSFGSWVTFQETGSVSNEDKAFELMKAAYDGGVNFFDNAEAYGFGEAEKIMGAAVKKGIDSGAWTREDLVISTKLFFGAMPPRGSKEYKKGRIVVNRIGLSRKHIVEGMKASLKRMDLEYVDLVFCHRFDPLANLEEVVRSFNYLIDAGLCFYWGTSEWTSQQLQEAKGIAEKLGLIGPSFDQPEYNLLHRRKVEIEFAPLYPALGLTVWSPLASGVLTGKYKGGNLPEGSRLSLEEFKRRPDFEGFLKNAEKAELMRPIAEKLECTMGQLALAWCMANPNVSTVITGASSVKQVEENLGAIPIIDKLTPRVMKELDDAMGTKPRLSREMAQSSFRYRHVRQSKL